MRQYCTVEYGGGNQYGGIFIADALPSITNRTIGNSSAYGIYMDGAEYPDPATIESQNTFCGCAQGNVYTP